MKDNKGTNDFGVLRATSLALQSSLSNISARVKNKFTSMIKIKTGQYAESRHTSQNCGIFKPFSWSRGAGAQGPFIPFLLGGSESGHTAVELFVNCLVRLS